MNGFNISQVLVNDLKVVGSLACFDSKGNAIFAGF